jgi:Trypsin-co-occurring domain 1
VPWGAEVRGGIDAALKKGGMAQLVEFPLGGGGSVLIEVADTPAVGTTRGLHPMETAERAAVRAQHTLQEALGLVEPVAQSMIDRLGKLADPVEEIRVEFGVDLRAEVGAFIASTSSAANFKIILTVRRPGSRQGLPSG